jgi:hypothetical protein
MGTDIGGIGRQTDLYFPKNYQQLDPQQPAKQESIWTQTANSFGRTAESFNNTADTYKEINKKLDQLAAQMGQKSHKSGKKHHHAKPQPTAPKQPDQALPTPENAINKFIKENDAKNDHTSKEYLLESPVLSKPANSAGFVVRKKEADSNLSAKEKYELTKEKYARKRADDKDNVPSNFIEKAKSKDCLVDKLKNNYEKPPLLQRFWQNLTDGDMST